MNAKAQALTQNRWGFILFMSAMCSLSPFAMSFIIPAFPGMAIEFDKPVAEIQFLVSAFLIGLGLAQPIHGLMADRYGRRPVLLIGFAIFIVASIASVLTTSWTALVVCRFFQAAGVSAGTVISRAIVNDIQPREEAAISLSYISIAMGLGPIIAPIFGGVLDTSFGWRSIFIGCVFAGAIIFAMAILRLPETRPKNKEPRNIGRDYKRLLGNPKFIGYTLMFGFGQGVFFAFLPFAPDYFENVLGHSTAFFISCWIALSLAFMFGSLLGTRFTKRFGMDTAILWASLWLVFTVVVLAAAYAAFGDNAIVLTGTLMLTLIGTGLICPLSLAGSISIDPKLAATAAGLSSSMGLMLGGLFTVIGGIVYDQTLWPFITLAVIAILGNLMAVGLTRRGGAT